MGEEEEEEEEALSLRDLPLDLDTKNKNPENDHLLQKILPTQSRRSSSESAPAEFFEFLTDFSSDMCPADDIIFCGKLVPLKDQTRERRKNHVLLKRSESLSELRSDYSIYRSDSSKNSTTLLKSSRSTGTVERNPSTRSVEKFYSKVSHKKGVKPRWYVFMFGSMVKFPPEMELQDMKSRQFRRSTPSVMFPTVVMEDGGNKKLVGGSRSSSGKGSSSWNLLKALSCRDYTSVAVTTSFWMPQT